MLLRLLVSLLDRRVLHVLEVDCRRGPLTSPDGQVTAVLRDRSMLSQVHLRAVDLAFQLGLHLLYAGLSSSHALSNRWIFQGSN